VLIIVALIIITMRSHHFNDCAGHLVEEQPAWLIVLPVEVKHVVQRASDGVE
jgi:hypothetical protein